MVKNISNPISKESLSFADAAEVILKDAKKPLSYKQLAKKAIDDGLIKTESATPEISMHVSIRSEMKRRETRGEPQRFVFMGNGLFSLVDLTAGKPTEATKTALQQIRESRRDAGKNLYERLVAQNNGPNFETMVSDLLIAMG